MVTILVQCPRSRGADVIKAGKQPNGTQRYRCQNAECNRTIFQLAYRDKGRLPETTECIKKPGIDLPRRFAMPQAAFLPTT